MAFVHSVEPGPFIANAPEGNAFNSVFARLFAAEGKGLEQKASRIYLPEQMESIAGKGFVRELCGQEVEDGETIPAGADPL